MQATTTGTTEGWLSTLTRHALPAGEIKLDTSYKAVAVRVHTETVYLVTFASIYIPGRVEVRINELNFLIQQLSTPFVLMGEFKAHHREWGNSHNDSRRCVIEQVITESKINFMNTGSSTHLSVTAIDLTLISPSLNAGTSFRTFPSVLSSNHYPIIVTSVARANNREVSEIYNYKKGSWKQYSGDAIWKDLQRE